MKKGNGVKRWIRVVKREIKEGIFPVEEGVRLDYGEVAHMNKREIRDILQNAVNERHKIVITRNTIDTALLYGIPLMLDDNMLLIQYIYDYQLDGYMILRIKDITFVRSDERERFSEYILKQEGLYDEIKKPMLTTLRNWRAIFEELKEYGKNILVEFEDLEEGEIFIGRIIEVNRNSLEMLCFDAMGKWDNETMTIIYKDITTVKLDDRYTTVLSRYLQPPLPRGISSGTQGDV